MKSAASIVIAGCFALCAFTVAIFAGMASENSTAQILLRAVVAMLICYPVGLIAGSICQSVVTEHFAKPASPDSKADSGTGSASVRQKLPDDEEVIAV